MQINGGIKEDHLRDGPAPKHGKRNNDESVEKLLAVPRYRTFSKIRMTRTTASMAVPLSPVL
jgi:hypothetical protein